MGIMKRNVSIVVGALVVIAALYGIQKLSDRNGQHDADLTVQEVGMKQVMGEVVRVFEGENKIEYSFSVPESATTTLGMEGALVKVTNDGAPVATVYFSYEGGRGYSSTDYINNIIAPNVAVINPNGTSTVGSTDWETASSEGSEWSVAAVRDGEWLVVVENRKTNHDLAQKLLASLKVN
jgi:hypothetical protein